VGQEVQRQGQWVLVCELVHVLFGKQASETLSGATNKYQRAGAYLYVQRIG